MEFFKKHYRGIALSFLIGVLLPAALSPSLKADISSENYFQGIETVDEVVVQYHLTANTFVNVYLDLLTDSEFQDATGLAYVDPRECSNGNQSTYCLAVLMDDLLVDFEEKLRALENDYDVSASAGSDINSLSAAVTQALNDREKIDHEIQVARDTLDLTLAVYNQVQTVYPLHKELADLVGNMESYRDNLAAIRSQLELYPSKFNNATSATCK